MLPKTSKPSSDAGCKAVRAFSANSKVMHVPVLRQDAQSEKERISSIDKQAACMQSPAYLTMRHRAPNGVPARAKTRVGGEGTSSPATPVNPAVSPVFLPCAHESNPKRLARCLRPVGQRSRLGVA